MYAHIILCVLVIHAPHGKQTFLDVSHKQCSGHVGQFCFIKSAMAAPGFEKGGRAPIKNFQNTICLMSLI